MRLPCEDTPHRPTPENSSPRYIVALYAETRTQTKATAQRRPHGQIAARWGELRFGLRSESWAYRLGFIRTDWSGWAGLRGRTHRLAAAGQKLEIPKKKATTEVTAFTINLE